MSLTSTKVTELSYESWQSTVHRITMLFNRITLVTYGISCLGLADAAKTIWINQIPGYSSLSSCALEPVSAIVRDMSRGCGDNNEVTSQNCFCTSSYSYFNSLISKTVSEQCSGGAQASSAGDVFERYCDQVRKASSEVKQTAGKFRRLRSVESLLLKDVGSISSTPSKIGTPSPGSTGAAFLPLPTTPTTTSPPPGASEAAAVFQRPAILLGVAMGLAVIFIH